MDQVKHEKIELKAKVAKAKNLRDRLLIDAKTKKTQAAQLVREKELEEVQTLQEAIKAEKDRKLLKR
jgi:hypothetical protein